MPAGGLIKPRTLRLTWPPKESRVITGQNLQIRYSTFCEERNLLLCRRARRHALDPPRGGQEKGYAPGPKALVLTKANKYSPSLSVVLEGHRALSNRGKVLCVFLERRYVFGRKPKGVQNSLVQCVNLRLCVFSFIASSASSVIQIGFNIISCNLQDGPTGCYPGSIYISLRRAIYKTSSYWNASISGVKLSWTSLQNHFLIVFWIINVISSSSVLHRWSCYLSGRRYGFWVTAINKMGKISVTGLSLTTIQY